MMSSVLFLYTCTAITWYIFDLHYSYDGLKCYKGSCCYSNTVIT